MATARLLGPLALAIASVVLATAPSRAAAAQDSAGASSSRSFPQYWAIVTANDVYVRSAPSVESSYPFRQLGDGDIVKVVQEASGWARVSIVGPAFSDAFGFVRADRRVTIAPDGRTAEVTSRTDLFAPNLSARNAPDSSWKSVARIEPGATLVVLETIEGQRDTVYKVPMPAAAEGWINLAFLRKASDADMDRLGVPRIAVPDAPAAGSERPVPPPGSQVAEGPRVTAGDDAPPTNGTGSSAAGSSAAGAADPAASGAGSEVVEEVVESDTVTMTPGTVVDVAAAEVVVEETPRITLGALDAALKRLMLDDAATAEFGALRSAYLAFAEQPDTPATQRDYALARVDQLTMREEVQANLAALRRMRDRDSVEMQGVRSILVAAENRQPYAAVGRLNASQIFDGDRLPLLFRVQDPAGGQTVAYVRAVEGIELFPLLGQLVGVLGTRQYDTALRVNVVSPVRVDLLTASP